MFRRKTPEEQFAAEEARKARREEAEAVVWARDHPFGEEGSVEYWIEAMKRAHELGYPGALSTAEWLAGLPAGHPPISRMQLPSWFMNAWTDQLAPYNSRSHRLAMPY